VRTLTLFATAVLLVATATWSAETQGQGWPQTTNTDNRFSVEFGAKAYDRPGSDLGLPLISDSVTNQVLFDSDEATDLGSAPGAEVKFNFQTRFGREIEVRTIIAEWEQAAQIQGAGLQSPFFPAPGAAPTTVDFGYEADYFSIEVMSRRTVRPGTTLMFGPRFVSSKDLLTLAGTLTTGTPAGPITVTQTQTFEATNALIGLQGGFELNFPISQSLYLNGYGRFGGYLNPTEVNFGNADTFTGVSTTDTISKSTGSFLAEIGGRIYVDIFPNALSAYVGYEATWIDGFALAPAQALTTGAMGVETANTPFWNAATIGLRWTY